MLIKYINIFSAHKSDCESGLLPRCNLQAGEREKGKHSHKDNVAKEEGHGLIPPIPLNSHQWQNRSGRVNGFAPVH